MLRTTFAEFHLDNQDLSNVHTLLAEAGYPQDTYQIESINPYFPEGATNSRGYLVHISLIGWQE